MSAILIFAVVFCVSYFGVGLYRRFSLQNNLLDIPNERSSHSEPIPHGAGLVIVIICLAAYIPISFYVSGSISWGYFAGALLVALISFLDDVLWVPFGW